jgi:uncharacterized membrane protein YbhN (UPF0104 family)
MPAPNPMRWRTPDRRLVGAVIGVVAVVALYLALPAIAGLDETWRLLKSGNAWWLGLGIAFELCSYAGYVLLFQRVFGRVDGITLRRSCEITLAGVAATRLLATAGAGGIALTGWALRRSGMPRAAIVSGLTTFFTVLYSIYMAALVVAGFGLSSGLLPGPAPFGLTVVPAVFGTVAIAVALAAATVPGDLPARVDGGHRVLRAISRAMAAVARGVRGALGLLRTRDVGLLGAVAWWGFDIAVLWACFHAFGGAPPFTVVVLMYFVGMLANTLPLPGGIGGVEGGMIGAAIGFGVDGGLAIVAVLAYRGIAFWLPTVPGAIAYLRLRQDLEREDEQQGDRHGDEHEDRHGSGGARAAEHRLAHQPAVARDAVDEPQQRQQQHRVQRLRQEQDRDQRRARDQHDDGGDADHRPEADVEEPRVAP